MINVLMIGSDNSVKGGITSVIKQLLSFNWKESNVNIKFIPSYHSKNTLIYFIKAFFKILFYCIFKRPDILHIHMSYKGSFYRKYVIQAIAVIFSIPSIIHLHGSEFEVFYNKSNRFQKIIIRNFLRSATTVLVLGEKWKSVISKIEPNTHVQILRNTVKNPNKTVKYTSKPFNILFSGVLIKRKGVADLIKALNYLKIEYNIDHNDIKLSIAGEGPELSNLINLSNQLELLKMVNFEGWKENYEMEKLLISSQLFALPSYNEGLPISILEAISYGLPVVSTNVGSIDEAVNENGLLVKPNNHKELAFSIKEMMVENKWNDYSRNSVKLFLKEFNEDKYFENVKKIYISSMKKYKQ